MKALFCLNTITSPLLSFLYRASNTMKTNRWANKRKPNEARAKNLTKKC